MNKGLLTVLCLVFAALMVLVWTPSFYDISMPAIEQGTIYGKQDGYYVGIAVGVLLTFIIPEILPYLQSTKKTDVIGEDETK